MTKRDIVIVGGGPAGLAAAAAAFDAGARDILIIEREPCAGGILNQCIHNGFGLHRFKRELTGPEYARIFLDMVRERGIELRTRCTVLDISPEKKVTVIGEQGLETIEARAVILAMGCRERTRGAIGIAGTRPAGVYTAGTAQRFVNILGLMPGKRAVILGSGDIGLIMARRMTLEGAKVEAVLELMPYSGGLRRNIAQCLNDFKIPLYFSRTVTEIHGRERVEGITHAAVDERRRPVKGTEQFIACDTLLLSVGLIPENELTLGMDIALSPKTNGAEADENRRIAEGVYACGNVLHVHDLADYVSDEAELAGRAAAAYILNGEKEPRYARVNAGEGVSYVVPQRLSSAAARAELSLRVSKECENARLVVSRGGKILKTVRKRKFAPGEMERLDVELGDSPGGDIEVRLEQ